MSGSDLDVSRDRFDAVLLDLDGVLTATARMHAACWKAMFDAFLSRRAAARGEPFEPFDAQSDYRLYVDGRPRYEGVRSFLESRSIGLPHGDPADPPDAETICGLGNRKNDLVREAIASGGVEVYDDSVAWVRRLRDAGIRTAVVSSSRNCEAILRAAGIAGLFDLRLDGEEAARRRLAGKPAPDTFLEAARRLGVEPRRAVVVEDAISGVRAGRAGGFGLVIGLARQGDAEALRRAGADLVVRELGELLPGRTAV
ncbi:MAG: HAD family hydrolase [Acidobacteriota bacterium]